MYFVVYIVDIKQNRTVPHTWIRDVNNFIEMFINSGIKHNRTFYTFWTHRPEAFDVHGIPRKNYRVNLKATGNNVFPHEGWYRCFIKKFRCEYL